MVSIDSDMKHKLSPYAHTELPVKRNYHFDLDTQSVKQWHQWGLFTSAFFNALSIVFPSGETMFIRAVQSHKQYVPKNSLLRKQMDVFVAQEAIHGREHQKYNDAIRAAYPMIYYVERFSAWLSLDVNFGVAIDLATTVGLEHWTDILAEQILSTPSVWQDADPRYGMIWHWHALEESEHKAVAYDVYQYVYGTGLKAYLRRCFWLLLASVFLWLTVYSGFFIILCYDYHIFNVFEHLRLLYIQFVSPGILRKVFWPFWEFMAPSFHPWKRDNQRQLLKHMHDIQQQMKELEK